MTDIVARLRDAAATWLDRRHSAFMREAADEIERLRAKRSWQPIETAPKDGTQIIISNWKYAEIVMWDGSMWMDCEGNDLSEWKWWIPMP